MWNYFEIWPFVYENMSFKGFSSFSSGGLFFQRSGSILAIYEEEIILKSSHCSRGKCHLKVFLFLALAANLFSGVEQF